MGLKNEPSLFLAKKTWEYSAENKKNVVIYIALFVFANIVAFFQPLVIAWLLNTIQEQGITKNNIWHLVFITSFFIWMRVGFWLFHLPARIIERNNSFVVRANYKKYLVDGVLLMPAEWHTNHHSGDTIDKIEKATAGLYQYSGSTFEIIEAILRFASSYIALMYFNLNSAYIILVGTILAISTVIRYDKILRNYYREINRSENATSQKIFDIISNITTIIILRIEKIASSEIYKKIMHPFQVYRKNVRLNEFKWAAVSMIASSMTFLVMSSYLIISLKSGSVILVGTLSALYAYVERINDIFFRFASRYSEIVRQKTAVENAEEISKEFMKSRKRNGRTIGHPWKTLHVENLNFSYDDPEGGKEKLHLNNISLKMMRGEKIALIGESGSGKTTFLKLLRGMYVPNTAKICLDDFCVESFDDISEDIALIPQEPEIFATTIRENITMGLEYHEDDIKKYTDLACFTHVVERLPRKIDSSIVEKGVNLSGGEKQRLALSRGLLFCEEKEIILLDEPTSSVDSKNELAIYKNIFDKYKDKTIISSIHRLHMLNLFDTIYFFDKGEIIASGNLAELKRKSKKFNTLWKKYHEQR